MKSIKNQSGFAGIEIGLLVVVAVVLGFVAFRTYTSNQVASNTQTSTVGTDITAPTISSTADLTRAETIVDQLDPGASSTEDSQLDTDLATF